MQERVGGRVKTFGTKEGFAEGLYVDGESCEIYGMTICMHDIMCACQYAYKHDVHIVFIIYMAGGAMRLPGALSDVYKPHFLSDFYAKRFKLPLVPFNNADENCFLKFYNMKPVQIKGTENSLYRFPTTE